MNKPVRRTRSLLVESPRPEESPSLESNVFSRQNCSTPVSSKWTDENSSAYTSPYLPLSQREVFEVAWRWDEPGKSPVTMKKPESPRNIASPQEEKIFKEQALRRLRRRKAAESKNECGGFSRFRLDLLALTSKSNSTTTDDSPTEALGEKSTKVETTDDMIKYVFDDSYSLSGLKNDKTVVEKTPTAGPSKMPDRDLLFDDSNIDKDLCALNDVNPPVVNPQPQLTAQQSGSDDFFTCINDELKTLERDWYDQKDDSPQTVTSEGFVDPVYNLLIDDSLDDILSQFDGQMNDSRNKSFTRRASMPAQKSQVGASKTKIMSRYDSMPVKSTLPQMKELSRNTSNESVASTSTSSSGRCSSEQIQLKRREAMQRLEILRQQKNKNLNKR
ncbi:hypothetical protein DMENIID0001_088730 [Sergentomyia squamirostris]